MSISDAGRVAQMAKVVTDNMTKSDSIHKRPLHITNIVSQEDADRKFVDDQGAEVSANAMTRDTELNAKARQYSDQRAYTVNWCADDQDTAARSA